MAKSESDFNAKLEKRYPHILAMREFQTYEEIKEALRPGVTFYETCTFYGRPVEVCGPCTVLSDWSEDEFGTKILVNLSGLQEECYLENSMQNSLGKAIFTDEARARAYYETCCFAYERDKEWQEHARKRKAESGRDSAINWQKCFDEEMRKYCDKERQRYCENEMLRSFYGQS